jgi:hypothetical protein
MLRFVADQRTNLNTAVVAAAVAVAAVEAVASRTADPFSNSSNLTDQVSNLEERLKS